MTYKKKFAEQVSELITHTKQEKLPRDLRIESIKAITDSYVMSTDERPDPKQLERLTDALLHEELTDKDRMKVRNNEYPVMSETQLARRRDGVHQRKQQVPMAEVPLGVAENIGNDGRDYRYPNRRKRSVNEMITVDEAVRSRNREIRRKYNEFIKEQPVTTYKMSPQEIDDYLQSKYTKYQLKFAKDMR